MEGGEDEAYFLIMGAAWSYDIMSVGIYEE